MDVLNKAFENFSKISKSINIECIQRLKWSSFYGPQVFCTPSITSTNNHTAASIASTITTTITTTTTAISDGSSSNTLIIPTITATTSGSSNNFLTNLTPFPPVAISNNSYRHDFPFSNNQSHFDAIQSAVDTFKCNLYSKHASSYEAIFNCTSSYADNAQQFINDSLKDITNCIYNNVSVIIKRVRHPVSELELILPKLNVFHNKFIETSINYSHHATKTLPIFRNQKCATNNLCVNLNQVLICNNLVANNSFCENDSFANTDNSTLMEPVKCLLSLYCVLNGSVIDNDRLINNNSEHFLNLNNHSNNNSINNSELFNEFNQNDSQFQYDWTFLLLVILFIVAGGLGNILVCLAVALDRKLQNVTNYFLFSLAIADLLVSLFVMPLGAVPSFLGYWPFGFAWCNIYVTCDVLACSSSILHMCFISLGRYTGIRNPLGSRHHSTKRRTTIKIAIVWAMAMLVSSSITVLGFTNRANIMPEDNVCMINNRYFYVFGSLVAFYIPMIVMVLSYALTVQLLSKKARFTLKNAEGDLFRRTTIIQSSHQQSGNRNGGTRTICTPLKSIPRDKDSPSSSNKSRGIRTTKFKSRGARSNTNRTSLNINLNFLNNRNKKTAAANAVATEQKATKVLGVVFFTFVLCWSPFFILNIIFAACPECYIPPNLVLVCLWLGYVSSTINPIIYTIFNKTFRAAFIRLLKCNCSRTHRLSRYRSVTEGRNTPSGNTVQMGMGMSLQSTPLLQISPHRSAPHRTITMNEFRGSYTITDDEC